MDAFDEFWNADNMQFLENETSGEAFSKPAFSKEEIASLAPNQNEGFSEKSCQTDASALHATLPATLPFEVLSERLMARLLERDAFIAYLIFCNTEIQKHLFTLVSKEESPKRQKVQIDSRS
jgi:hypothetical protein